MNRPESLRPTLIAPCGMDCGVCSAYLREKNHCPGCREVDAYYRSYGVGCKIRNCVEISASDKRFCFECVKFPCPRLRQLDKRYRTRYGMSMIENLESMRLLGLEGFVTRERDRWKCPGCGGVICVHKKNCIYCGHPRN